MLKRVLQFASHLPLVACPINILWTCKKFSSTITKIFFNCSSEIIVSTGFYFLIPSHDTKFRVFKKLQFLYSVTYIRFYNA